MTPNFPYLVQELTKLDQLVNSITATLKIGLEASDTPQARKVILDVLDEINRLRKMTYHFSSETERHNWHIALDRREHMHLLVLGDVVRAEFAQHAAHASPRG